jgi:organic hydroperoxide reductase OsmC/OhrA
LYRAHSDVTDGRVAIPESNLDLKLTTPKEVGGGGGDGTNSEQLFAAVAT